MVEDDIPNGSTLVTPRIPRTGAVSDLGETDEIFTSRKRQMKLVCKDHPRDQQIVVLIHRRSLYAGLITWKVYH